MIVRGARPEDLDEVIALELAAFPTLSDDMIRAFVVNDPWGELEHTRIAVVDGRIASAVRIAKRPIRLGSATVSMGGISGVGTLPELRGKGGASACMNDALLYMRGHGMPLSSLFTDINPFYERLGYETLLAPTFSLPPSVGRTGGSPVQTDVTIRRIEPERDLPAVMRIYDRFCEHRGLTLARNAAYWRAWPTWATWEAYVFETPEACLIAERDGAPVAYSRAKLAPKGEPAGELMEMCCLPRGEAACLPLFARTAEMARERGFGALNAMLPPGHPLLAQLGNAGSPIERQEFPHMMWRVVDLRALLEAVRPDLSQHCVMSGECGLKVGEEQVTLRCAPGSVRLSDAAAEPVEIGAGTLVALLSGRDLPATPDVAALREGCPELLGVLNIGMHFPGPVCWHTDDF